jgi:hypothetical protein
MALSELVGVGGTGMMRAVAWHNVLARLGLHVPLVVVHDLGCVISGMGRAGPISKGMGDVRLGEAWRQLLVEVADTDLARVSSPWKHRDAMVGAVLARALSSLVPHLPEDARLRRGVELPVEVLNYIRIDPRSAYARYEQDVALAWLRTLCHHRLLVLLELEQIDIDALRLLGLFRGEQAGVGGIDLADLYSVLVNPNLSDMIDFSLELLPSLLEVKRDMGHQSFGIDGYSSIERTGTFDSLLLSQLAFDDEEFAQKYIHRELFYYTHERQFEHDRRTHYILVDGSASMRGVREVFARGLALALSKRLNVLGETCILRFFDSRLHDGVRVGEDGFAEVPYVLQFRAERGRNYAAVIRQLNAELSAPRRRDTNPLVYLITHGECQFPADEIAVLTAKAPVYGVFILPHGDLNLPYVNALHRVHVIDRQALALGKRASYAREIIDAVESDLGAASSSAMWRAPRGFEPRGGY